MFEVLVIQTQNDVLNLAQLVRESLLRLQATILWLLNPESSEVPR